MKEKIMLTGLCGRSGAGKGYVSSIFSEYGIPSIDTDDVYRKMTSPSNVLSPCMKELKENYPAALYERYGIECGAGDNVSDEEERTQDAVAMLETACKRRGFILRGGEFDYDRGARAVIDDFRKGRLGKICLENPNDFSGVKF